MIDVDFEAIEDDPEGVVRIDNADFLARPVRLGSSEASALIVALRALREGSPDVLARGDRPVPGQARGGCRHRHRATAGRGAPDRLGRRPAGTPPCSRRPSAANRQARLDYYVPTRDETTRRTVDPLELLTAEGHDYLDAWCHLAGARRLFRLDRMHAVELVDEPRQEHALTPARPLRGPLRARTGRRRGRGPPRAPHPLGGRLLPRRRRSRSSATAVSRRRLRVGDPRWLVRLALRLAPAVTVVEPPGLRERGRPDRSGGAGAVRRRTESAVGRCDDAAAQADGVA